MVRTICVFAPITINEMIDELAEKTKMMKIDYPKSLKKSLLKKDIQMCPPVNSLKTKKLSWAVVLVREKYFLKSP